MTKYLCGHEQELVILDDNVLSIAAYLEWKDTVGIDGGKLQCWECYCKNQSQENTQKSDVVLSKDEGQGRSDSIPQIDDETPESRQKLNASGAPNIQDNQNQLTDTSVGTDGPEMTIADNNQMTTETVEQVSEDINSPKSISAQEIEEVKTFDERVDGEQESTANKAEMPVSPKTPQQEAKNIAVSMRFLLNDYPNNIQFKGFQDRDDLIHNILLIYDLLLFCKNKTNKEDVLKALKKEILELEKKIDFNTLRALYLEYKEHDIYYGLEEVKERMLEIINPNINYIANKVQYYTLAIPGKGKKYMRLSTSHGLASNIAEEYEQKEIEEGKSVDPTKPFTLSSEGDIVQVSD